LVPQRRRYALETLRIYTRANVGRNLKQLDNELRELNTDKKLEENLEILKKIFTIAKEEMSSCPSFDSLFHRIRTILIYEEVDLSEIVDKNAFENLKKKVGNKQAYSILAFGIIKYYIKKERLPHPYIFIRYDP